LIEWWYNTSFYLVIKSTSFEALYDYPPPQLSLGTIIKGNNQAVTDTMEERQGTIKIEGKS
jgi:hypothetical protein